MSDAYHNITLRQPDGAEHRLRVRADETILDAAEAAGIEMPSMCCQGWCLTCAARLLHGEVEHPDARRYYRKDTEGGFILPCTARPRSDCVILTDQKPQMVEWRDAHRLPAPRG